MKEKYLHPAVVNSAALEREGLFPIGAAAALAAGYAAGRVLAKVLDARPEFKLPSLTKGRRNDDDFCMA